MKSILVSIVAAVLMVGCGSSIHQAAMSGNTEAVKQHLTEGVDVNAKDGVGRTPLHEAATYGDEEVAELLIANDADVSVRDDNGWTALHYASDRKIIARFLIDKGAKLNAINNDGETPLDRAIDWEDSETADLLRKQGGKTSEQLK